MSKHITIGDNGESMEEEINGDFMEMHSTSTLNRDLIFTIKDTANPLRCYHDFYSILKEMQEIYNKKNHDYGNSFSETIQEFGFIPAVARINDKLNRVKQMVKGEQMRVKESLRDNLMDIANYCVLTIIELDNQH